MRVLIGCEESGTTCTAFRNAGHEAFSCDLLPTRGNPEWHYQIDVTQAIRWGGWDVIILHPDCTAISLSGNRHYGVGMPKHLSRMRAVIWTVDLWELAVRTAEVGVALENPTSVIFQYLPGADVQFIHPWQFGHGEQKKTGLALHGLPRLEPTNVVDGREQRVWKMPPGPNRKRDRSKTYDGIAKAMAEQWGNISAISTPRRS